MATAPTQSVPWSVAWLAQAVALIRSLLEYHLLPNISDAQQVKEWLTRLVAMAKVLAVVPLPESVAKQVALLERLLTAWPASYRLIQQMYVSDPAIVLAAEANDPDIDVLVGETVAGIAAAAGEGATFEPVEPAEILKLSVGIASLLKELRK